MLTSPFSKVRPANGQAPHRTARGYLGHKRPDWERADLAAQAYVQGRSIDAPTLQQLAFAYRVSVASIQRRLNGKHVTVDEALAGWRAWTPQQRAAFGRGAGAAELWDDAISPVINEERDQPMAAE
jgi:hypothetical protein